MPDDPSQVIYVWWDALGNYVTALDYGTGGEAFDTWWRTADERIHVVGKGIVRFHAVYWPAMLLSAGELPPTKIYVHPYLTAEGRKLSKSAGNSVDPVAVVEQVGTDALRWWLLRDVPRTVDADFTIERVVTRSDEDLAHGVGNLVHRIATMVHRLADGTRLPPGPVPTTGRVAPRSTPRSSTSTSGARSEWCATSSTPRTGASTRRGRGSSSAARPSWPMHWVSSSPPRGSSASSSRRSSPTPSARVVAALTVGVDGRLPDPEPVVQLLDATVR